MHSILVHALGRHLLVAFGHVAGVAHVLSLMGAVLVLAHVKLDKRVQNCSHLIEYLRLALIFELTVLVAYMLNVLPLSGSYGFQLVTLLLCLGTHFVFVRLVLVLRISFFVKTIILRKMPLLVQTNKFLYCLNALQLRFWLVRTRFRLLSTLRLILRQSRNW